MESSILGSLMAPLIILLRIERNAIILLYVLLYT